MHEGWAPATRDQVFVDFSGSPRTLFRGVLHTLQESGASVTVAGCVNPHKFGGIKWRRNLAVT